MKKILSVLLCTALIFSALPLTLSVSAETFGDYEYDILYDGTAEITKYKGSDETLTIPSSINGHTVTSIGDWAFEDCTSLTSVTIPNSVTSIGRGAFYYCTSLKSVIIPYSVKSIGDWAFSDCTSLTSVTIPNSVTSIGGDAFYGCTSLTSVTIPNSVTSIGESAFRDCTSLTSVTIPNSVTSIGDYAFYGCTSLTSITIPNSVTSIGWRAFERCTSLTEMNVDSENKHYSSENGVLFNKEKTELIQYPAGKTATEYLIPNSVKSIGGGAFIGCTSLTSVTIPNTVTSIGDWAFEDCTSLTSVTIPNSVTSIGDYAFYGCTSLTSVTIPNSVTSIGWRAFHYCASLISINVDSENKYYSSENGVLFNKDKTELIQYPAGKTATEYSIPNSVTSIGGDAFYGCTSLTSVTIPISVTSIGRTAFANCTSLTSITIPNSIISIGQQAFGYYFPYKSDMFSKISDFTICGEKDSAAESYANECGFTFVVIYDYTVRDDNTIEITRYNGSEETIEIPDTIDGHSVASIGAEAFKDCTSLKSITIPASVTNISSSAFEGCTSLTIYGAKGSAAESYANEHGFTFIEIEQSILGDVNDDGEVNLSDVRILISKIASGAELTAGEIAVADLNGDGKADLSDIRLLISKIASGQA